MFDLVSGGVTLARQRTFDDLGAPLIDVPFCVVDLETTGGSAASCEITEIGAVRYRGGALEGSFQTLVNPGAPIPPFITVLTGITQAMVVEAPRIEEALPAFLEFCGDAVIVGHNIRFDMSFLNAAAERLGYGRLPNRTVDTVGLARRLVRSETRNMKLSTLAAHFRSPVSPTHRALDDAKATAHVFWALLERAGTIGATHLDDLLTLPTARGKPTYGKIRLTEGLPRRPGVYFFKDRDGEVIYVGKAKDLRSRVRAYFYGDTRRTIDTMLRELHTIDHRVCATELEASVAELRLIRAHSPRHNRRSKRARSPHWVRLTDERFPRLSMARSPKDPGLLLLGPFRGRNGARTVVEALWDATRLRRCTGGPGRRSAPCAPAQMGRALCPCDGTLDEHAYRGEVETVIGAVRDDPDPLLDALADRVAAHARAGRFEEAAWVRDRHRALARALERRRAWNAMQAAGRIHAVADDGSEAIVDHGRLIAAWRTGDGQPLVPPAVALDEPPPAPVTVADAEEAHLVWTWLMQPGVRLVDASGGVALPARPIRRLERIAV
ncbi:MAG: DEDD exonuclease domain-containing protein [Acidimicrobiia bacterium]|nr:DEDD exonuclease domain-containing protein [Acidimicrobiia bacterium]